MENKNRGKRGIGMKRIKKRKRYRLKRPAVVVSGVICAALSDLSCQLRQGGTSLLFLAGAGSVVSKPGRSACGAERSLYPAAME